MNKVVLQNLEKRREQLARLCEKFGVERLELFGSATGKSFQVDRSDLDFLVVFKRDAQGLIVDRFLGLAEALEQLFGCPVDLLTERMVRNPYFRQSVNATRELVYAHREQETAV